MTKKICYVNMIVTDCVTIFYEMFCVFIILYDERFQNVKVSYRTIRNRFKKYDKNRQPITFEDYQ